VNRRFGGTSVHVRTTRRYVSEVGNIHNYRSENVNSYPSFHIYVSENDYSKHTGAGVENLEYGRRDPSRWPRGTLCPQKLALTSPTSGGRSVGTVLSRIQATEFSFN
jgi:hypothetical protein